MQRPLCICGLIPTLPTRTRVLLVLHQAEQHKTTNTGLLAVRCLPNSAVLMRGRGAPEDPAAAFAHDPCPVLLFPHDGAVPIERFRDSESPVTLIVPDGTWTQAIRARRRLPGLASVPCAVVPVGAPSAYRLRRAARPGQLCTLEAIARALGVLEGPEVQRQLEGLLRIMVERTLWSAGRLGADEVAGGIPPSARPTG